MPCVLWWGRGDRNYSRNRTIARLFVELGWENEYFQPIASELGLFQAYLARLRKPDLIWVPCFRQRDMFSAVYFARNWGVPLVCDPLTSAYQKETYERRKFAPGSWRAMRRRRWESRLFHAADRVVLENAAYVDFVNKEMGIPKEKLGVLYNGADTRLFKPLPPPGEGPPFTVGFVGSFQPSMGTDVIVKAAGLSRDLPCRWILIGEGDDKPEAQRLARDLPNVAFSGWVPYEALPQHMAGMHILLGIFGTTLKTDFVIPNKIFEAMAVARPLITQKASSYNDNIGSSDVIGWVPRGDPGALAGKVRSWLDEPAALISRGEATRRLFDDYFGDHQMKAMLAGILAGVMDK